MIALSDEFCTAGSYTQLQARGWSWQPGALCNASVANGIMTLELSGSYTDTCGYMENSTHGDFGVTTRVHLRRRTSDTRPSTDNGANVGLLVFSSLDVDSGMLAFGGVGGSSDYGVMLNPYRTDGVVGPTPNEDTAELLLCYIQGQLFFGARTALQPWTDMAGGTAHPMPFFGRLSLFVTTNTYPRDVRADVDYVRVWDVTGAPSFAQCLASLPQ